MNLKPTSILDILGISSATICLVHCLIFPILSVLPFAINDNHWIDIAFSCVGMFVVSKVIMSNALLKIKIILGISITLVMLGVILETILNTDFYLVIIGGIGMITGHTINYKYHNK